MTREMGDVEEFKLVVSRRKKRVSHIRNKCDSNVPLSVNDNENDHFNDVNCESLFGLLETETEFRDSLFADNVFHCIKTSLNALNVSGISEILCYGLGSFSSQKSAKYQLALLLSLKNHYCSRVRVYDPIFTPIEMKLLTRFGLDVLNVNEEGKRIVEDDTTLVYMPHCSIHLINNFLYANWGKRLSKCILLTNSFSVVVDNLIASNVSVRVDYIVRIRPYVREITLRNNFPHEQVFNDLNIHIFLEEDIAKVPGNFWTERKEPCYSNTIIDYFTVKQTEEIDAKNYNYLSRLTR
ncbi:SRR1-like protein isoform X2 [Nomia melanderi]|uniref:SRR1-like protein isoform X2 n=1 Tax=Nomia melanderi TaxID=2448451 RepID=UPI0013045B09|nr:SRR1-like protein isoform X2 [Nomia melanderi]